MRRSRPSGPGSRQAPLTASAAPPAAPSPAGFPAPGKTFEPTQVDLDWVGLAVHEAGHAVAGVLFGGALTSASVVNTATLGMRGATHFGHELMDAHNGSVALAGPWAEARWQAGRLPTSTEVSAALWKPSSAHSGSDAKRLAAAGGTAAVASDMGGLLERCWPAITTVARKLVREGEALHDDVTAALGLSADRGRHPFEISNIRAGLRTVPGRVR